MCCTKFDLCQTPVLHSKSFILNLATSIDNQSNSLNFVLIFMHFLTQFLIWL